MSHLELQVSLTRFSAPNVRPPQVYYTISERFLKVPNGLAYTFHILQHTLKKIVTEKLVKGSQIGVGDVIEFENLSGDCIKTGNERNDYMPALSEKNGED